MMRKARRKDLSPLPSRLEKTDYHKTYTSWFIYFLIIWCVYYVCMHHNVPPKLQKQNYNFKYVYIKSNHFDYDH